MFRRFAVSHRPPPSPPHRSLRILLSTGGVGGGAPNIKYFSLARSIIILTRSRRPSHRASPEGDDNVFEMNPLAARARQYLRRPVQTCRRPRPFHCYPFFIFFNLFFIYVVFFFFSNIIFSGLPPPPPPCRSRRRRRFIVSFFSHEVFFSHPLHSPHPPPHSATPEHTTVADASHTRYYFGRATEVKTME